MIFVYVTSPFDKGRPPKLSLSMHNEEQARRIAEDKDLAYCNYFFADLDMEAY